MTGGASSPHPSSSTLSSLEGKFLFLEPAKGLKPPVAPLLRVGLNAGLEATGGGGPLLAGVDPPEYFEPEASETF